MREKKLNQDAIELCKRYFTKGSVLENPDKSEKGLLKDLSEEYRTYEVCWEAVKANPINIFSVPKRHLTKEIYTLTVEGEPSLAYIVPRNKLTEKICIIALKKLNVKLSWVPRHLRTPAVCEIGIEKERGALKDAPKKSRTYTVCLKSVSFDGANVKDVPDEHLDDTISVTAIMQHPQAGFLIPEDKMTYEVYKALVQQKVIHFDDVPVELRDADMCYLALTLANETNEVIPYFPIEVMLDERIQDLTNKMIKEELKKHPFPQKKEESVLDYLKANQPAKEKKIPKSTFFTDEASIDFYPYN